MLSISFVCPKCSAILKTRYIKDEDFQRKELRPVHCNKCKRDNMKHTLVIKVKGEK